MQERLHLRLQLHFWLPPATDPREVKKRALGTHLLKRSRLPGEHAVEHWNNAYGFGSQFDQHCQRC